MLAWIEILRRGRRWLERQRRWQYHLGIKVSEVIEGSP
jgi:hypothetical protein